MLSCTKHCWFILCNDLCKNLSCIFVLVFWLVTLSVICGKDSSFEELRSFPYVALFWLDA